MVLIEEVGGDASSCKWGHNNNNNKGNTGQEHAWSLSATDRLGRLEIVDHYDDDAAAAGPIGAAAAASAAVGHDSGSGAGGGGLFLDPREAERLVDGLETFGLEDVGSSRCVAKIET